MQQLPGKMSQQAQGKQPACPSHRSSGEGLWASILGPQRCHALTHTGQAPAFKGPMRSSGVSAHCNAQSSGCSYAALCPQRWQGRDASQLPTALPTRADVVLGGALPGAKEAAPQLSYSPSYYPKASHLGQWSSLGRSWPTAGVCLCSSLDAVTWRRNDQWSQT